MKKYVMFVAAMFFSMSVSAQKVALHTSTDVLHFIGTNGLIDAYNAASAGDTIYLPGGSFTAPAEFAKKLTIFGAGHYLDSTMATGKTFINGNIALRDAADNFHLEGVEVTGNFTLGYNEPVNGVVIKRCRVIGQFIAQGNANPSLNMAFVGNVLMNHVFVENCQNVLFSNNIFQYGIDATNGNVINNNIFLSRLTNGYYENFRGNNNQLSNNIFILHGSYGMTGGSGNVFRNNIINVVEPGYGTSPSVFNDYTGVNPTSVFVSQTGNTFNYAHNYHLQSPSTYLGTDGTQIGIYGGAFPYKEGAVPSIPHIQQFEIAPTTTTSGMLNIQVKASAQDN